MQTEESTLKTHFWGFKLNNILARSTTYCNKHSNIETNQDLLGQDAPRKQIESKSLIFAQNIATTCWDRKLK